jgi:hypothetical protein
MAEKGTRRAFKMAFVGAIAVTVVAGIVSAARAGWGEAVVLHGLPPRVEAVEQKLQAIEDNRHAIDRLTTLLEQDLKDRKRK